MTTVSESNTEFAQRMRQKRGEPAEPVINTVAGPVRLRFMGVQLQGRRQGIVAVPAELAEHDQFGVMSRALFEEGFLTHSSEPFTFLREIDFDELIATAQRDFELQFLAKGYGIRMGSVD